MNDIVSLSRELMKKQTSLNKAPSWLLTEISIKKAGELCKIYEANEILVLSALYLAHTIFDPVWKGEIQEKHPFLSAEFAEKYLDTWQVSKKDQEIILNAIKAHHNDIPTLSREAEIVKNAECYKFISKEGCLIWLHELGLRGIPYEEAKEKVHKKCLQKMELLSLDFCIEEAKSFYKEICNFFEFIS